MKQSPYTEPTTLYRTKRVNPLLGRITAGVAMVAWLVLAGEAFGQNAQVWGDDVGGPVFAPADLDAQLSGRGVARPQAPIAAAQPQAAAPAVPAAPVYAPANLATSSQQAYTRTAPAQQQYPQQAPQPYGLAPFPGQGNGYGYPSNPFGGFNGLPQQGFGNGYPYGGGPNFGNGFGNGYGVPPGYSVWNGQNNSYPSNSGIPFFGGSPFGFW